MDDFERAINAERGGVGAVRIRRGAGVAIRGNRMRAGAPVEMVQSFDEQPVQISPEKFVAADRSYFGIGYNPALTTAGGNLVAAGADRTKINFLPERPIEPMRWIMPSTITGLFINQIKINGTDLLPSDLGVPCELFSEVSTAPDIDWITINTTPGVQFYVSNPTGEALLFTGAFAGTQARS